MTSLNSSMKNLRFHHYEMNHCSLAAVFGLKLKNFVVKLFQNIKLWIV